MHSVYTGMHSAVSNITKFTVFLYFLCNRGNTVCWMSVEMLFVDCTQLKYIQYLSSFDRDLSMLSCMSFYHVLTFAG